MLLHHSADHARTLRMPVSTKADAACLCGAVLPDQTGLPVLSDAGWLAGAKSEVAWDQGGAGRGGLCRGAVDNRKQSNS